MDALQSLQNPSDDSPPTDDFRQIPLPERSSVNATLEKAVGQVLIEEARSLLKNITDMTYSMTNDHKDLGSWFKN